jgi:hypothetical protein
MTSWDRTELVDSIMVIFNILQNVFHEYFHPKYKHTPAVVDSEFSLHLRRILRIEIPY